MFDFASLAIRGHEDRPVANTFLKQRDPARRLAVLYPGLGYNVSMPLMYYTGHVFSGLGADVLLVDTAYNKNSAFSALPEAERDAWAATDAVAALDEALRQRAYERVTLAGKSIGTLAAGAVLEARPGAPIESVVWLTPLIKNARLRQQAAARMHRALFITGSADPHYDAALIEEARKSTGGEVMLVDGANHSLEIPGDLMRSLAIMRQVIERIDRFAREV